MTTLAREKTREAIKVHASIEEALFYPAVRQEKEHWEAKFTVLADSPAKNAQKTIRVPLK